MIVVGKESVGKTLLIGHLTGRRLRASLAMRGSTVAIQSYSDGLTDFIDTPGIIRRSDAEATRRSLEKLRECSTVLLLVQATHLDEDLADLLPLVKGKRGIVVATFWDKVSGTRIAKAALSRIADEVGVPLIPLDARDVPEGVLHQLRSALEAPPLFKKSRTTTKAGFQIEPPQGLFDHRVFGPVLSLLLLIAPATAAVAVSNAIIAPVLQPLVKSSLADVIRAAFQLPPLLSEILAGKFGLLTMGPLLFVWAVPVVFLFSLFLAAYKASGLLDRVSEALDKAMLPFGLAGRDLVRVLMGFGCNVPAVISTRSCPSCTRGQAIRAIAFGSACSYQFGSTLAVFGAVQKPGLVLWYLLMLGASSLVFLRVTGGPIARSAVTELLLRRRSFLQLPQIWHVWVEASTTLRLFFSQALPVFLGITLIASLLNYLHLPERLGSTLGPAMKVFNLPGSVALPVLLASIRKDGILLLAEEEMAAALTNVQIVTSVYLAGVLLPCLVTALAVAREKGFRYTGKLLLQQATAAVVFSLLLAWLGAAVVSLL